MSKSQQTQQEKGKVKQGPPRGSMSLRRLYDIGMLMTEDPGNESTDS